MVALAASAAPDTRILAVTRLVVQATEHNHHAVSPPLETSIHPTLTAQSPSSRASCLVSGGPHRVYATVCRPLRPLHAPHEKVYD